VADQVHLISIGVLTRVFILIGSCTNGAAFLRGYGGVMRLRVGRCSDPPPARRRGHLLELRGR
jgi:hypothetical protein